MLNWLKWVYPETDIFPDHIKRLMKYTKLLPNWVDTVINYNKVDTGIMKDCNKTAVRLPDFEVHAFYYNLKREGKSVF